MGNTLGSRIRFLRDEKELSQLEMARELNISNAQLSRYESGARKPDPEMLIQIADYFHVSTDYLLGRVGFVKEASSGYERLEDKDLLKKTKSIPGLEQLIDQMANDPDQAKKFIKIWDLLH
ncbi:helix-turn-helix domain-containing protein [Sporolactobacillus kofuensis]|uniref:Helix-turn-helix domain-containing protein n=1 Tax=Sporolactobacillus kofuensis TaxID=269672 RepID=A0ABW1WF73_9BACL|nr:helix-turn-helix transcriptional regulator [Sporolactobacillus kofuensis]MCO7176033.1 helix-turn-helix domain-containing protein [Sporolactobacillus kofuensis]